jgi:hypothetical protein
VIEFVEVVGDEVGQRAVLQLVPELFDRIESGSVGRQVLSIASCTTASRKSPATWECREPSFTAAFGDSDGSSKMRASTTTWDELFDSSQLDRVVTG